VDKDHNPWKTLSQRPIYDNPWINVSEDKVINPNGGDGIYGLVHFKHLAIGIIPIDEHGNTWLVGQYRYALSEYSWEIPMGGGALTLDPVLSAQRELKEETGLSANDWRLLMKLHTSNSVSDEVGWVFVARQLTSGQPQFDDTEAIDIQKLPLAAAIDKVLDGTITDAISVAGLLKLRAQAATYGLSF